MAVTRPTSRLVALTATRDRDSVAGTGGATPRSKPCYAVAIAFSALACSSDVGLATRAQEPSAPVLEAFAFSAVNNPIRVDSQARIREGEVRIFLPPGTPRGALRPTFGTSTGASVRVGGTLQTSGTSALDFTAPVRYVVAAPGGRERRYVVTVVTDLAAFDDVVESLVQRYHIPAVSIAVTHDERLVYLKAYGWADLVARERATTQSRFRLASVSKPITAIAILRLAEQGKLRLSDRVFGPGALLGTIYGTQPYEPRLREITVDHFLHHTAGGWTNDAADPMFAQRALSGGELISWTLDHRPLAHAPGTSYAYSNFGYCLLGRIIERVTGQPYEQAVKALVLEPAGITDMAIGGGTLAERLPGEVRYHGQGHDDPYLLDPRRMDAHGGWVATARDLAQLLVHVDGYSAKPDLLQPSSIETMTTGSSAKPGYACGWGVNANGNWEHMGGMPGTATLIIRGANGWGFVLLANSRSPDQRFVRDMDLVLWTALARLDGAPEYDLFVADSSQVDSVAPQAQPYQTGADSISAIPTR